MDFPSARSAAAWKILFSLPLKIIVEKADDLGRIIESMNPVGILHDLCVLILRIEIAILFHMFLQFLGHVLAIASDAGKPAEMIQSEIIDLQIFQIALENLATIAAGLE